MTLTIINRAGLEATPQALGVTLELGGTAPPRLITEAISSLADLVRFQVGVNRAGALLLDMEEAILQPDLVAAGESLDDGYLARMLQQYGIVEPSSIEEIRSASSRYGAEAPARSRAAIAERLFLGRDPSGAGVLQAIETDAETLWRMSRIRYENPLEILFVGIGSAAFAALKATHWVLDTVKRVQEVSKNSLEVQTARVELETKRIEAERARLSLEEEKWRVSTAFHESGKARADASAAIQAAEMVRLEAQVAELDTRARRQELVRQVSSSGSLDPAVRQFNAVARRLLETGSPDRLTEYEVVIQATVNVSFQTTLQPSHEVAVKASSLERLPELTEVAFRDAADVSEH